MVIVTGGFGFIGSHVVKALNRDNGEEIIVVDNLLNGKKIHNLSSEMVSDFISKEHFLKSFENSSALAKVKAVFHLGACSSTTEWDGNYLMENNFSYSKSLLEVCEKLQIPFIYASSASVYGHGLSGFDEHNSPPTPINAYAFSKAMFDNYVRKRLNKSRTQIVGLRYFNVYEPHEQHKGSMASVIYHLFKKVSSKGVCELFEGGHGYNAGEQCRDFVYVGDCAQINKWFFNNPKVSGIFNVGTGKAYSFNSIAEIIIKWYKLNENKNVELKYIPFPENLLKSYQSYTKASLKNLHDAGCKYKFLSPEEGVSQYLSFLAQNSEY